MKRVLLFADDQPIADFFREKFHGTHIALETARDAESAAKICAENSIDLALIDPVIRGMSAIDVVKMLRAQLGDKPLLVFAKLPQPMLAEIEKSGAAKVLKLGSEPAQEIFNEVHAALGLTPRAPARSDAADEEEATRVRLQACLGAAAESITAMRMALHAFVKNTQNTEVLRAVFCEAHHLSGRAALVGLNAAHKFTTALEALLFELLTTPEAINVSTLRTVSQCADLLSALFQENNLRRANDPVTSDVFVVEDEPEARKLIGVAMNSVKLKITCAADPEMALSVLEDNMFDLIFLDVKLPEGSGFDLCAKVRQIEEHKKTPVVFLTGMNTFQTRAQSTLSGGNDFVAKPFNLAELGLKALTWIFKNQLGMA